MQPALRSSIPDASLAVFPVNGENSHRGLAGRNPAPNQVREACKFTVLLGMPGQAEINRVGSRSPGKERDSESGNDYFGARYYSSSMGRWMGPDWNEDPDPVPYAEFSNPQSLNLYAYVQNNPLTNTDASGNDCVTQSRTSDTGETVTVTSGGCGSGGGTYVAGTVTSITAGADGHSIDIGYTPDSGGSGVTNVSAASNGPKMDEGAVVPEGEGQLVGLAVGGAVGKIFGAAARG